MTIHRHSERRGGSPGRFLGLLMSSLFVVALAACGDGDDGAQGPAGPAGPTGAPGPAAGATTSTIISPADVTITVLPSENTLAGDGTFALKFTATAKNAAGEELPLTGIDMLSLYSATVKTNTTNSGSPLEWVNNGMVQGLASSTYCTLTGEYTSRGTTGKACTLVEDASNPGTYTGTWTHTDAAPPLMYAGDDLAAPHRLVIRVYNLTDASGTAIADKVLSKPLDYVPSTGALVESTGKDVVTDAACIKCHSEKDGRIANISAHSNYQSAKLCVACHNSGLQPDTEQAAEGWVFDFGPMIHRVHAGHHLASKLSGEALEYFGEIGFPSPITECTACHDNGDTWNTNITRDVCTSCHMWTNFETGEGHFNGLAQPDDSQCKTCHSSGSYSPEGAHQVGKRAEYKGLFTVDFTNVTAVDSATAGYKTVTITANITMNGAPIPDGTSLATYNASTNPSGMFSANGLLIGNVGSDGTVYSWRDSRVIDGTNYAAISVNLGQGTLAGGVWTRTLEVPDARATGTIYVAAEAKFCVRDGQAAACNASGKGFGPGATDDALNAGVGNDSPMKVFNVDGGTAYPVRAAVASKITIAEDKCNACHNSLDYAKGYRHGTYTFDQCLHCHNDQGGTTGHPTVVYKAEDGTAAVNTGVTFGNKDLVTVAHRYHSGNFDGIEGVFRDYEDTLHGYPAVETDCAACHKDSVSLFASDGGLASGKRSIKVNITTSNPTGYFVSPVAESCRGCHAHANAAALAHFKSNGAVIESDLVTDPSSLSIESCAVCHAEGKTYGIDKVHAK